MRFEKRRFSRRFVEVECALFFVTEEANPAYHGGFTAYRGTACAIVTPDGRLWIGVSLCSPGDRYVKKIGRAKARGRAVKAMTNTSKDCAHGRIDITDDAEDMKKEIEGLKACMRVEINEKKRQAMEGNRV